MQPNIYYYFYFINIILKLRSGATIAPDLNRNCDYALDEQNYPLIPDSSYQFL
jgi:hypothetical protein